MYGLTRLCIFLAFLSWFQPGRAGSGIRKTNGDPGGSLYWTQAGQATIPIYIITKKPEGSGRIDRIVFHPSDSNLFYAASPGGGLWKTVNYGESWIPLTDELPVTGIADVAISLENPDNLWIATGDAFTGWSFSNGLYFSDNGGATWSSTSLQQIPSDSAMIIHRISVNPQNDLSVFAGTSTGLMHSEDQGASFRNVASGRVQDMEWLSGDSAVLLFTLSGTDGQTRVCRSLDAGISYDTVLIPEVPAARIELCAAQGISYALLVNSTGNLQGIFRSENQGEEWIRTAGSSPNIMGWTCEGTGKGAGLTILSFSVNPLNVNELYAGSNYMWKSTDGGKTWKAISGWCGGGIPYVRPYHRALAFGTDKKIYTCSGGGIFRSPDAGKSWTNISANLFIMPITALSTSSDSGFVVAGTLENGSLRLHHDKWQFLYDGDGMTPLAFDSLNFIIQVRDALSEKIRLLKTGNGGNTFFPITPTDVSGNIYSPVLSFPGQNSILFFSYGFLVSSADAGFTWEKLAVPEEPFRFIEQSTIKPAIMYAAGQTSVWRSMDLGHHWASILNRDILSESPGTISALELSNSNPNLLWIAFSGWTDSGKVIQTDDGGQSWEDISQGLPSCPVYALAYDSELQQLFAGTEQGVFVRTPAGQWLPYGSNLPHCRVNSLALDAVRKLMYAGTLGRGVWQAPLEKLYTQPVVDFSLSSYVSCGSSKIIFTGKTSGLADSWLWDFGTGAVPAMANGPGPHEVGYPEHGLKTIRLVVNDSVEIIKKEIVEVVSAINVEVLAKEICTSDTVSIMALGADSYSWSPDLGIIKGQGTGNVLLFPRGVVTYSVKGTVGNCQDADTVVIKSISDEISMVFALDPGINGPYTNECATAGDTDPVIPTGSMGDGCNSQDGWCRKRSLTNTVWFSYIIPESGFVGIDAPGDFDNQIALFLKDPVNDSLTLLAANDNYFGPEGNNAASITGIDRLEPGSACLLMVDGGGTGETGLFQLIVRDRVTGLKHVNQATVRCFPNPAADYIFVTGLNMMSHYEIVAIDGRLLKAGMLEHHNIGGVTQLDVSGIPDQLVLLKVGNEEGTWVFRIKIENK